MFGFLKEKTAPKTIVNEEQIEELLSRGIENIFPNKEFLESKLMKGEKVTLYLGVDPTGPTLHLGHLIPLLKLSKFQKMGHQIILLMGDFTAMIGDPTDKTATRKKLSREEVLQNLKEYQKQAGKFISFSGTNKALFKFNSEWHSKMNFEEVLDLASNFTVQQMLERDMFAERQKDGKPIYIHEFLYPLMQGYDSVAMNVDGEIGGNDQTFNMLTGRTLLKSLKNKEKFVIATKLLIDSTGKKMGKTENNMVALNQSPEEMFGRVMSWDDELIAPGFEIITDVTLPEIEEIKNQLNSGKNPRDFKIQLAREIVKMYYGIDKAKKAEENFEHTFSRGGVPEDILEVEIAKDSKLELIDVVSQNGLVSSRSEFVRLFSKEGVEENSGVKKMSEHGWIKIVNIHAPAQEGLYKIGKRRFIKIKFL